MNYEKLEAFYKSLPTIRLAEELREAEDDREHFTKIVGLLARVMRERRNNYTG